MLGWKLRGLFSCLTGTVKILVLYLTILQNSPISFPLLYHPSVLFLVVNDEFFQPLFFLKRISHDIFSVLLLIVLIVIFPLFFSLLKKTFILSLFIFSIEG